MLLMLLQLSVLLLLLLLPSPIYVILPTTYNYGLLATRDLLTMLSYYDYNNQHLLLLRSTDLDSPSVHRPKIIMNEASDLFPLAESSPIVPVCLLYTLYIQIRSPLSLLSYYSYMIIILLLYYIYSKVNPTTITATTCYCYVIHLVTALCS